MQDRDLQDDPWIVGLETPPPRRSEDSKESALAVDMIDGIKPLDDQFGVEQKATVPEALRDYLFGELEPTTAELSAAGGDATRIPSTGTYAILDAAKVVNLPELLESSGLEHRCLFKGKAFEELKDAAPWIVRLEESNGLTRNLFTQGDAPWHLWSAEPGIYIRSRAPLDDIWRHLRKFTKLRDSAGRWVYFRFWEPDTIQAYLSVTLKGLPESQPFFGSPENLLIRAVISYPLFGEAMVHRCDTLTYFTEEVEPGRLTPQQEIALTISMERRQRREIVEALRRSFPEETSDFTDETLTETVRDLADRFSRYGIRTVRSIHLLASWQLFYGVGFETRDPEGEMIRICGSPMAEDAKLKRIQDRLSALYSMGAL